MIWHTDVSIGDFHYLRSKFAERQGSDGIFLSSFNKATEAFYYSKQFRVNGDYYLAWAFLAPDEERDYLSGNMKWLNNISHGHPWIIEAYMPKKSLSAMHALKHLIPVNSLKFKLANGSMRELKLPDLTG